MSCSDCMSHARSAKYLYDKLMPGGINPNPLSLQGSIEITLRCNVRCKHCYILYPGATNDEMNTDEVKQVLQKMADGGVLFLLITGGEILTRPDFKEIYLHAKQLGFIISLYTNATLINEDYIEFFKQYPPRKFEVTIYGHTEETYENVTGVKGSFTRFRRGVELLLEAGLDVILKCMVLNSNQHEFKQIRAWAIEKTGAFQYDINVAPRLDRDRGVLQERLNPEDHVRLEAEDPDFAARFHQYVNMAADAPASDDLFKCGAAVKTCHVDPRGRLHPCMLWRENGYDLLHQELDENWRKHVHRLRAKKNVAGACNGCSSRVACGRCPAASFLEMDNPAQNIPHFCEIRDERFKKYGKPAKLKLEIR